MGTSWKPKCNGLWDRENVYPKFSFLLAVYYWTIHFHPKSQFPLLCRTSISPGATLGPRGGVCKYLAWCSTLTCWCRFSLLLGGNTRIKISLIRNSNADSPGGGCPCQPLDFINTITIGSTSQDWENPHGGNSRCWVGRKGRLWDPVWGCLVWKSPGASWTQSGSDPNRCCSRRLDSGINFYWGLEAAWPGSY